jgi:hypothetical protein
MRNRLAIAVAVWLIGVSVARSQSPDCGDGPPLPLLPVPTGPGTPAPCCPTPVDELGKPLTYDRSLLYLPDRYPGSGHQFESRPRDERATWGRAAGLIGQTQSLDPSAILAGAPILQPQWRAGLEGGAGIWLNADRSMGLEGGVTYLAEGHAELPPIDFSSRFLTAHGDYRQTVGKVGRIKLDLFTGYRFASINEDVNFFRTTNQFHGGTIGLGGEYRTGPWSTEARASVALGATFADRDFNGRIVRDKAYGAMPELAVSFGREVLDGGRLFIGYRFLSLNRIVRPTTLPNEWSSMWTQGVIAGLDWWF